MALLLWDIYEINSSSSLQGVMLRGRLRKFASQRGENLLVENDEDGNLVRFAVLTGLEPKAINDYIISIVPDAKVALIKKQLPNPVLSKLKVNLDERYNLE